MIGTNNGMQQSVFDLLETSFVQKFNTSGTHQVTDSNGNVTYSGPGWKVFVPVIQTACPPGPINGAHQISGWTEMVITQVYDRNNGCAVNNPADTNSSQICQTRDPNLRAVFGEMFARLHLQVGDATRILVVPKESVLEADGKQFVFVVEEPNRYTKREVKVSNFTPDQMRVLEGLTPGQRIVTKGAVLIKGQEVKGG